MTSFRPRLRPHLAVHGEVLIDSLLNHALPLTPVLAALGSRLDGTREWTALRRELIDAGHDGSAIDAALRQLLLLHAVDGAGDAIAAKLERVVRRHEAVPTSILEGARFACQGSGGCCHGYAFGPLRDDDVARLEALDLAGAFPQLEPPYVEQHDSGRYLRKVGDQCCFLAADRRCGLHAAFGPEAKPALCRLYPLDSFGTVEGIRVVDRGCCSRFATSSRAGLPLIDDLPRLRALFDAPKLHHPVIVVDGWGWDYGLFLRFTTAATTLVRRNLGTAGDTLAAIGRCLGALANALVNCPLKPGQPDGVVNAVLAADPAHWYQPTLTNTDGAQALIELLRALEQAVIDTAAGDGVGADFVRFARVLIERLAPDGTVTPTAASSPGLDDILRLSLRQQLFGRCATVSGLAGTGLVRIGLIQLFAVASAKQDLSRGHAAAVRVFDSNRLDAVLIAREASWCMLVAAIAVALARIGST